MTLIRFAYASVTNKYPKVDAENGRLLDDGHAVLVISPKGIIKMGDCVHSCRDCMFTEHDSKMSPAELAKWLLENLKPTELELAIHPDMALPVAFGGDSRAKRAVVEIAKSLQKAGVDVSVSDRANQPFDVGTWVRFERDQQLEVYCVTTGMIACVVPDLRHITFPGSSISVRPVGIEHDFVVEWASVASIPDPNDEERKHSREQVSSAHVLYQARHGWKNIAAQGIPHHRAIEELHNISRNLAKQTDPKSIRGTLKRAAKLLSGYHASPWAFAAEHLSVQTQNDLDTLNVSALTKSLADFCEKIRNS